MLCTDKLKKVTDKVQTGLQIQFPDIALRLEPYYAGMGYCGVEIKIEELQDQQTLKNIETFYIDNHKGNFFNFKITNGPIPKDSAAWRPGEVRLVGENNESIKL